ncbi:MAG: aldehyde dehydrogenase [Bacteroidales bacterium]|jgi:aldehyde dehydrogenase (NAD+)|nr:aldehyde dehydrogenase [Bacteroidales bacterium]
MPPISEILKKQRQFFATNHTKDISFRIASLRKLEHWIQGHYEDIFAALKQDLNKPPFEAYATEIAIVLTELKLMLKKVRRWSNPKCVASNLINFPSSAKIYPEPYGVALIMSPWNYPFQLCVAPIVAAVAAGNCAVVKPSEYSPATSALIGKMCKELFDDEHIAVVEGGVSESQALLNEYYDLIFFTGSTTVGKIVMQAAAKHLTPVVLELGGKSPCIVDETASIKLAAKRIVWGKLVNAGQTCVAPDFLLVHESVKKMLIEEMKIAIQDMYGEKPLDNQDFPKIINIQHFNRLMKLIRDEKIVMGGDSNPITLQIEPTLLDVVSWDTPIMQEEIFGPILPILSFSNFEDLIKMLTSLPKPLAAYLFTSDKNNERFFLRNLSFGGGCINDTIMHLSVSKLPFGGVGESGMGTYHGKAGFDAFSHYKSILKKSTLIDVPMRYPPYSHKGLKWLMKMQK